MLKSMEVDSLAMYSRRGAAQAALKKMRDSAREEDEDDVFEGLSLCVRFRLAPPSSVIHCGGWLSV